MKNNEAFSITSFEILHECLDSFPIPTQLNARKIAEKVEGYFNVVSEPVELFNHQTNLEQIVLHTVNWLETEGFIKDCGSTDDGYEMTLTRKGLNALNEVPARLDDRKSFKEIILNGAVNVPFSTIAGVMVEFFKVSN